jgi:uncharacterized protein YkwD
LPISFAHLCTKIGNSMFVSQTVLLSTIALLADGLPADNQAYDSAALLQKAQSVKTIDVAELYMSNSLSDEMQEVLDKHNDYRCMHGVELMTWDDEIAANAQAVADKGVWGHSSNSDRQNVAGFPQLGENIAWGTPTRTGTHSTQSWYDEIKDTPGGQGTPSSCDDSPTGEAVCHYTQVVWKGSIKLGCGKGRATISGTDGDFWVCQYGIAGNMNGQFGENVLGPSRTEEECQSGSGSNANGSPDGSGSNGRTDITEVTTDPDCADKAADDNPKIMMTGTTTPLECSQLAFACTTSYVIAKCPKTCGAC